MGVEGFHPANEPFRTDGQVEQGECSTGVAEPQVNYREEKEELYTKGLLASEGKGSSSGSVENDYKRSASSAGEEFAAHVSSGESASVKPVNGIARPALLPDTKVETTHITAPSGAVILKRGMACGFCRHRKLRCGGGRPTCDQCLRLGRVCEYVDKSDKKGPEFSGTPLSTSEPLTHPAPNLSLGPSPTPSRSISSNSSRRPSVQRTGSSFNPANLPLPLPQYPPINSNINPEYESPLSTNPLVRQSPLYPSNMQTAKSTDPNILGPPYPSIPIHHTRTSQRTTIHPPPQHPAPVPASLPPASHPPALPPDFQYPAEDETAWYQAALKYDPPIAPQGEYIYHAQAAGQAMGQTAYATPPQHDGRFGAKVDSTPTQHSYTSYDVWQTNHGGSTSTPGAGPSSLPIDSLGSFTTGGVGTSSQSANTPLFRDPSSYPPFFTAQQPGADLPLAYAHTYAPPPVEGYIPGIAHQVYVPPDNGITPLNAPTQGQNAMYMSDGAPSGTSTLYPGSYISSNLSQNPDRPQTTRTSSDQSQTHHHPDESITMSAPYPDSRAYYHSQDYGQSVPQSQAQAQQAQVQAQGETTISTPSSTTVSVSIPEGEYYPPPMDVMYAETPQDQIDTVEKMSERLGEFFLGPSKADEGAHTGTATDPDTTPSQPQPPTFGGEDATRRRTKKARGTDVVSAGVVETDGLSESARNAMLDVFFQYHKMFLDLSIPRFKYRLTFHDRRRPSLALLNAMYMWATRMSHPPDMTNMESYFYQRSVIHLDASAATGDRLMDCIRAAYLLSAFQYMNGRHHSGYLLCGHASQLAKSCGLHQIASTVFQPGQSSNPLLRSRTYLLPPPHDALELGERIHTFWAVLSLDRSSSALTGFTSSFRDSDVVTPFPRELGDIASGMTTHRDDVSVRDLYRLSYQHTNERSYLRWIKAVIILERASKLVFIDPEESSEHSRQWSRYPSDPIAHQSPPGYLEQPRYRCPEAFAKTKLGLEQLILACEEDGVFPVDKKRNATMDGKEEVVISPAVIIFHHILAAIEMLLYDTNSLDAENTEALIGARKSVALIRELPPVPIHAVDAFAPLTWVMIAKVLIKEMHRLRQIGDLGWKEVEQEVKTLIDEIYRVGEMMPPSRMYAKGVEELMRSGQTPQTAYPKDYQPSLA